MTGMNLAEKVMLADKQMRTSCHMGCITHSDLEDCQFTILTISWLLPQNLTFLFLNLSCYNDRSNSVTTLPQSEVTLGRSSPAGCPVLPTPMAISVHITALQSKPQSQNPWLHLRGSEKPVPVSHGCYLIVILLTSARKASQTSRSFFMPLVILMGCGDSHHYPASLMQNA